MTATEILRRLLDEHGVEHKDFFDQTWWEDSDGAAYIAVETRPLDNNNPSTKLMLKRTATPTAGHRRHAGFVQLFEQLHER